MEKVSTLKIKDLDIILHIYYVGASSCLSYELKHKRKILFKGDDYRPSPLRGISDLDCAIELLSFFSLGKYDVEESYFDNYTPEQIEFRDSFKREELSMVVYDVECYHEDGTEEEISAYEEVIKRISFKSFY